MEQVVKVCLSYLSYLRTFNAKMCPTEVALNRVRWMRNLLKLFGSGSGSWIDYANLVKQNTTLYFDLALNRSVPKSSGLGDS